MTLDRIIRSHQLATLFPYTTLFRSNVSGSNSALQGSNYTDRLKAKGLRSPSELIKVYDVNPMFGGRIVRDKLWFFSAFRDRKSTRLNSSHLGISYAVFCCKKKTRQA